jgi:hypothetical protein
MQTLAASATGLTQFVAELGHEVMSLEERRVKIVGSGLAEVEALATSEPEASAYRSLAGCAGRLLRH